MKEQKRESIFEKEDIQSVIFDLDDTLFQTGEYYKKNMLMMASFVAGILKDETPQIAEKIFQEGAKIHKKNGKPILLNELMKDALIGIYGKDIPHQEEINTYLDNTVEQFYKGVPELFPGTLPVLEMLEGKGIKIAAHSHAQTDWVESKVEYIKNKFFDTYKRELIFPFHSTPLEGRKDSLGWTEALHKFNFNPTNTLVVGDNLRDDILAAQEVGIEHVVLINGRYSENADNNSSKEILRISNIGDLLKL